MPAAAADTGSGTGDGTARKVIVRATVPLRQLVGYATVLRSRTAGEGSFTMSFSSFDHVGAALQAALIADPSSA